MDELGFFPVRWKETAWVGVEIYIVGESTRDREQ